MLLFPRKQENKKLQRYKELRESGREFVNEKVSKVIPKRIFDQTAKEMNLLVKSL